MATTQTLRTDAGSTSSLNTGMFIHTEVSDRQVAEMLTKMMGPKVLLILSRVGG